MGSFLRKFGYLKLRHYGLQLDEHNRVITFRDPTIIAALGGATVGWTDQDSIAALAFSPAIMARSGQATPATGIATVSSVTMGAKAPGVAYIDAQRSAVVRAPAGPPASSKGAMTTTAVAPAGCGPTTATSSPSSSAALRAAPLRATTSTPLSAPALDSVSRAPAAPGPGASEPTEDEWEWVLALARARTADESPIVRPVCAVGSEPVATRAPAMTSAQADDHTASPNTSVTAEHRASPPRAAAAHADSTPERAPLAQPNRPTSPTSAPVTDAQSLSRMPRAQSPNAERLRARFARATSAPPISAPASNAPI